MTSADLARVKACLQATLRLDGAAVAAITDQTTAAELPQWTSMAHLELVLALEREFDVIFEADEIATLGSVPAIDAALQRTRTE